MRKRRLQNGVTLSNRSSTPVALHGAEPPRASGCGRVWGGSWGGLAAPHTGPPGTSLTFCFVTPWERVCGDRGFLGSPPAPCPHDPATWRGGAWASRVLQEVRTALVAHAGLRAHLPSQRHRLPRAPRPHAWNRARAQEEDGREGAALAGQPGFSPSGCTLLCLRLHRDRSPPVWGQTAQRMLPLFYSENSFIHFWLLFFQRKSSPAGRGSVVEP